VLVAGSILDFLFWSNVQLTWVSVQGYGLARGLECSRRPGLRAKTGIRDPGQGGTLFENRRVEHEPHESACDIAPRAEGLALP
jgi:hypothetical protein